MSALGPVLGSSPNPADGVLYAGQSTRCCRCRSCRLIDWLVRSGFLQSLPVLPVPKLPVFAEFRMADQLSTWSPRCPSCLIQPRSLPLNLAGT